MTATESTDHEPEEGAAAVSPREMPGEGFEIKVPGRASREIVTYGIATVLGLGSFGGMGLSHSSLSSKVEAVLVGQQKLEKDFAEFRGAGTDSRVREQDVRLRLVEEKVARIEGQERGK